MIVVMDFQHPVEAVIPGAQGRILAVLLETSAELNLRTIARLSAVSIAQVSRVLVGLVELGLVERREVPPSSLFRLVPDHVANRALVVLADVRNLALSEMGRAAGKMRPAPVSVIAFGSFARGESELGSDIDVIVVRSVDVDADDDRWIEQVKRWRSTVRRVTGNQVEIVEVDARQAAVKLADPSPLWRNVRRDGQVVFGKRLDELAGRVSA